MSEADREVALESGAAGTEEQARTGATYRLRLVGARAGGVRPVLQRRRQPDALVVAALPVGSRSASRRTDRGRLDHAWREGYVPVNHGLRGGRARRAGQTSRTRSSSSTTTTSTSRPGSSVPGLRRPRCFTSSTSPGCSRTTGTCFPTEIRVAIHDGLLANDLVGFHTPRWQRNFLQSAEDVVPGRRCSRRLDDLLRGQADQRPRRAISVDVARVRRAVRAPASARARARDRRDAAGVPGGACRSHRSLQEHRARFRGFRALARDCIPSCTSRVTMLALLDPSRQDIPEYAEYLGRDQREARSVNERFQRSGWTPIDLQIHDDFHQSVAAYKQYDVLLVNAIFDGLNLVAKEAPLVNERDGVLVLSENAGAFEELGALLGGDQPVRRPCPGRRDLRGADDARGRAPAPNRGDPVARARARSRLVDRRPACRSRHLLGRRRREAPEPPALGPVHARRHDDGRRAFAGAGRPAPGLAREDRAHAFRASVRLCGRFACFAARRERCRAGERCSGSRWRW